MTRCPCCSAAADLVDVVFDTATGAPVQTGNVHQCPVCLTYFSPGDGCEPQQPAISKVAAYIRLKRKEWGWSLRELSERSLVSKGYLSTVENGKTDPSLSVLECIAKAFSEEVGDFLVAAGCTSALKAVGPFDTLLDNWHKQNLAQMDDRIRAMAGYEAAIKRQIAYKEAIDAQENNQ
jgi:transcriptional regulator with XRE-family HTH domain